MLRCILIVEFKKPLEINEIIVILINIKHNVFVIIIKLFLSDPLNGNVFFFKIVILLLANNRKINGAEKEINDN